ncbi:MAG: hypothetical protein A3A16_00150 [Candidatus Harrisonbacteria bacterium RIFCSPLOWO2_01_FULL_44_18]|uniref:Uncharacterized protein n=1 Tax=Candidatus Harrisonbacteria bacterium RIFCSPLOWO2_01_FULL_44_18 TaxID=1798407 RepID=A0A1G1ZPF5_9BACT|nr:MAG: hypothetical protein A3A16_00150 [Candidatus Harrisonbacteria bacterium RIFCSPLOWO2_01_FULL_44_18]
MKWGVISNAHDDVYGWKFQLKCPNCNARLRFDEDEINVRVEAMPTVKDMTSCGNFGRYT